MGSKFSHMHVIGSANCSFIIFPYIFFLYLTRVLFSLPRAALAVIHQLSKKSKTNKVKENTHTQIRSVKNNYMYNF